MVKPNSEVRRRLVKQNLVARENNQLLSKKNSFQQVKQRSTLPKRANQKVQRIMKARPKPKSGDKNEFKRIECHFVNHVDALFMGILMCVSLLFGEDSEGVVLLVFLLVAIVSQKKS